jgi:predicted Rossmann fold flavoprotein
MKKIIAEQFEVLVIGGGPAGLMAAGRAAEKGARVALVEKNDRYAIKLLMTGNGRCNITQEVDSVVELSRIYKNGRFLLSSLTAFEPNRMRGFLRSRGLETKVERNEKVYPVTDQASDVVEILYQYCRENMVTFFNTEDVVDIVKGNGIIEKIITKKKEISAEKYILATGGKSYPQTGSNGEGYKWAHKLGHTIIEPQAQLVPIKVIETWPSELQGIAAHGVGFHVYQNGKKLASNIGDIMFAHYGFSGPLALNISRDIQKVISSGAVKLVLDIKPHLSFEQVDEAVRRDLEKNGGKNIANCLGDIASQKMLEQIFKLSSVDVTKHAAKISKEERQKISKLFKNIEFTVNGEEFFGFEKAMVTSGGVSTKEIDSKTMKSKLIDNLYFAGEIIDVDGPTGGYNLQICWSTGYVAGDNASRKEVTLQ